MSELRFTVPLPPKALSPNGAGRSWRAAQRPKAAYRQTVAAIARAAAQQAGWQTQEWVRVHLTFHTSIHKRALVLDPGYRPRDTPNAVAAWKAGFDGLVDAGIVVDDDAAHLGMGAVTIDRTGRPGVRVVITTEKGVAA